MNKLRIKLSIVAVMTVVMGLLCACSKSDKENLQIDKDIVDEFYEYMLTTNEMSYEDDVLEKFFANEEICNAIESTDKEYLAKNYFVKGMQLTLAGDDEGAILCYEESLKHCDAVRDYVTMTRDYVEIVKGYAYLNETEKTFEAYEKMQKECDIGVDEILYIKMHTWLSNDIVNVPGGALKCISVLEKLYQRAEEIEYNDMCDLTYHMARVYELNGDISKYMDSIMQALAIAKSDGDNYFVMYILVDLANTYLSQGRYEKAIELLESVEQYQLEDKGKEAEMKAYAKSNLAYLYLELDEYDEALRYALEANKYTEMEPEGVIKNEDIMANYVLLARVEASRGNYESAKNYLDLADNMYVPGAVLSYTGFDSVVLMARGDLAYSLDDYETALDYYKEVEALFELSDAYMDYSYMYNLVEIYKTLGDYEEALRYLEIIQEKVINEINENEERHVLYLMEEFESKLKAEEIAYLQKRNENTKYMLMVAIGAIILIACGAYIIWVKSAQLKKSNTILKTLSELDSLTGIQNRRSLSNMLKYQWPDLVREHCPLAVIMIDVDYFKLYNDNYGHQMGDKVLAEIGSILKRNSRNDYFAARYGGEEFIVIMPDTDEKMGLQFADFIKKEIEDLHIKHEFSTVNNYVTVSIGVAVTKEKMPYDALIKRADIAMYKAKLEKDSIMVYNEADRDILSVEK